MSGTTARRNETGAATVFVVGMTVVLLAVAGLVVDGGTALNARMKLADDAEQAARAGAQELDEAILRGEQTLTLNEQGARTRATAYMAGLGYQTGSVIVNGTEVTVTASDVVETRLLNLIGIGTFDVSATATAEAVTE